jgi:hypothetical protein
VISVTPASAGVRLSTDAEALEPLAELVGTVFIGNSFGRP